jgi:hypothetical protein
MMMFLQQGQEDEKTRLLFGCRENLKLCMDSIYIDLQ